ncbi:MAG TPA: 16S rRNA (cytosine(1402)-N(4))-methyltransferase RsmH [Patescibacteria group bacterium]|nr:16S rRNA (cytosine(1402)-N(4))-methyltransferase RsmH [Patescibacteria group bacterium]
MGNYHTSVLLQEVLDNLAIKKGEQYIDATLGGGGHTKALLEKGAIVLGIDQDEQAVEYVRKSMGSDPHLTIVQGSFANLKKIALENKFDKVAGILFDLGISSWQVDSGERGFSFLKTAPLDMRMDISLEVTAKDLVNGLHKGELIELLQRYGEEPFARRIAEKIVTERNVHPIETTTQLAEIITQCYGGRKGKIHPATRTFQSLRIAVNDELHTLQQTLLQALELLHKQGRIGVITFHSLEDRIVKQEFLDAAKQKLGKIITKKPIVPSKKEILTNKRARSAKLRVIEKL